MSIWVDPVPIGSPSFLDMPRCTDLSTLEADVAIIGVKAGVPYDMEGSKFIRAGATETIREQSLRYAHAVHHRHVDYDFGGELLAGREVRIVDCGNVHMEPGKYEANNQRSTAAVHAIIERGALPIVLGGGHEITVPVLRAYDGLPPLYLAQIDAHYDYLDEVNGVRDGLSSVMRRAAEMPWINGIAMLGLRGVGSGGQAEVDRARADGNLIVGARELHRVGVEEVLSRIPDAERIFITFDADGLDPTIAPGVNHPAFGGVTYYEGLNLLKGLARKGRIVGMDFSVVGPTIDINDRTSHVAARMILNLIGALAHAGQIGAER